MKQNIQNKKIQRFLFILLLTGSFLAAMKCIFIGYQMDEGYAVTLSYRMVLGDKMLSQIWDPHQTSAFFSAFLIWIYKTLFHTTAGVVIWLRICGTLIHGGLSYGIFKVLTHFLSREYSFYLALLYFNLLPKGYVTPEFSNLLIWFFTLLLLDLFRLSRLEKAALTAVRCGLWMCGMVLSYPSAVLLFPFILYYLWKQCRPDPAGHPDAEQKSYGKKDALIFAGTCLVSGMLYLAYLLSYMSLGELFDNLNYMLIGNSGHTEVSLSARLLSYGKQCGQALLISIGCGALAWLFTKLRKQTVKNKEEYRILLLYLTLITAAVFPVIYLLAVPKDNNYFFIYSPVFILLIAAFAFIGRAEKEQQNIIKLWLIGSVLTFTAVLMLTDLTIFTSIRYILPGIIMSLAALLIYAESSAPEIYRKYAKVLLLAWCFSSIFIKGWEYRGDLDQAQNITRVRGIISEGPAKGILAEYMQCAMQESLYAEMQEYTKPGDHLLLVENDTTGYLFQDVEVSSYTTISDPRYNEILLKYWELNPEKYPDVIIIPCWYGELSWYPESWITQWIVNEYEASRVVDGVYYRYYMK